jgi:hypothetical protein
VLQNRANQQPQQVTDNSGFPNAQTNVAQQASIAMVDQSQHQLNHISNQSVRFPSVQQTQPRMNNPQQVVLNPMTRLREPQKFNSRKSSKILIKIFSNFLFNSTDEWLILFIITNNN